MRKSTGFSIWLAAALLAMLALTGNASAEARYSQTLELTAGWNALHFEVTPEPEDIEAVFAGLPIQSVWRFFPPEVGVVEVVDPADGLLTVTGWFGYFPQPRPEAFLSNLFTITGSMAYLVNVEEDITINITGKPVLRPMRWKSNSFNLKGFTVDRSAPPTFDEYFAESPAHLGQPVYKLDATGVWVEVNTGTELINPDAAYWVYTDGPSRYQGPVAVQLDIGEDMDFAISTDQQRIIFENNSDFARELTLVRLAGGDSVPMSFELLDPETGDTAFPNLPDSLPIPIGPGEDAFLTIAPKRGEFTEDRMEDIYEVHDGTGSVVRFFLGANTFLPVIAAAKARRGNNSKGSLTASQITEGYAGLWIGNINIDGVSESQLGGTIPTRVSRPFPLRILIHVDSAGQARLLKNVIQMWQNGTSQPVGDGSDFTTVETPGRFVLLTDQDLIPNFEGAAVRDGVPVGIRYSTVAYDFEDQFLDFDQGFNPGGSLTVQIVTDPEATTNPFKHNFHPDHDNLDPLFINFRQEAFEITRDMELSFSLTDPSGNNTPGYGSTNIGGTFQEVITGVHKNAIVVSGDFLLERVSNVTVLNQ